MSKIIAILVALVVLISWIGSDVQRFVSAASGYRLVVRGVAATTHDVTLVETVYGEELAQPVVQLGRKSVVTQSMEVSAPFDATGDVWCFQVACRHWGTDFVGTEGTPVFAPFDLSIIAVGEYGPGPTMGQWLQGTFPDGTVFYAGHLKNRPGFQIGQLLAAGTQLGEMNEYAHTHVQLAPPGNTGPCAQDGSCIDFEQYYATH